MTGTGDTEDLRMQTVPGLVSLGQGFHGLFPISRNEVNQELQVQTLTLNQIAQRLDRLTPVRCTASQDSFRLVGT